MYLYYFFSVILVMKMGLKSVKTLMAHFSFMVAQNLSLIAYHIMLVYTQVNYPIASCNNFSERLTRNDNF